MDDDSCGADERSRTLVCGGGDTAVLPLDHTGINKGGALKERRLNLYVSIIAQIISAVKSKTVQFCPNFITSLELICKHLESILYHVIKMYWIQL